MRSKILTGYILPKFDMSNAGAYIKLAKEINLPIMPTLETNRVANLLSRRTELLSIKQSLDEIKNLVLNIRVGVNDFCNLYELRRNVNQTIYDIGIVRDILIDILNAFAKDYVVAGSVWNFLEVENFFVVTHSTTRSPIGICKDKNYPIREGFKLRSFYDAARTTFIYKLKFYDAAIIVTNAENFSAGLENLIAALNVHGVGKIILCYYSGGKIPAMRKRYLAFVV